MRHYHFTEQTPEMIRNIAETICKDSSEIMQATADAQGNIMQYAEYIDTGVIPHTLEKIMEIGIALEQVTDVIKKEYDYLAECIEELVSDDLLIGK